MTRLRKTSRPTLEALEDRLAPAAPSPLSRINHFVIIYQENWSFDGLYGSFPGANGIANASPLALTQVDRTTGHPIREGGSVVPVIPGSPSSLQNPPVPLLGEPFGTHSVDKRFLVNENDPTGPVKVDTLLPYDLGPFVAPTSATGDMIHAFWEQQAQINGVLMNQFVSWSDNPGLVMSHYDGTNLPEGLLAQQYTLNDNFFHAAYGGSFLNHQMLISATAPVYPNAPTSLMPTLEEGENRLKLDSNAQVVKEGNITPTAAQHPGSPFDNNYAVNTIYSANLPPSSLGSGPNPDLLPSQNDSNPNDPNRPYNLTIGDRLDAKKISWKWYAAGWDKALAGSPANPANPANAGQPPTGDPDPGFQAFLQPFSYYDNYAPWLPNGQRNPRSAAHLQDQANFFTDLANGRLPAVSFIKQIGEDNSHSGTATLLRGQQTTANIVHAIQNSTAWADTAIIITYEENGGRWDHVTPRIISPFGTGTRVPTVVISPYAKPGYVDHTEYNSLSILKTIEERFGLAPLNALDAQATSLANNFQAIPRVSIGAAYAQPDAYNPGKFTLIVQGTQGNDGINVSLDGGQVNIRIASQGRPYYNRYFGQPISRIEVYGQAGSDTVSVAQNVTAVMDIFAGRGNNVIRAGGGPTVVVGGAGRNMLFGGNGTSILIGGSNASYLYAGLGSSLLIAGATAYDTDAEALQALLAEWSSGSSYAEKIAHIVYGMAGGENGPYLLNAATVTSYPPVQVLTGYRGLNALDLFFARLVGRKRDVLRNVMVGEAIISI